MCFLTMPGGGFNQKVLLPDASLLRLLAKGLIEELETSDGTEKRYHWQSQVEVSDQVVLEIWFYFLYKVKIII